uniref:Uncharacterized protein n=1 Tax=Rhodnius prolixus TaxID=13249 RepID=T1HSJ3_RHOPR
MPPKFGTVSTPSSRIKRSRSSPELEYKKSVKKVSSDIKEMDISTVSTDTEVGQMTMSQLTQLMSTVMNNLLDAKLGSLATKDDIKALHDDYSALKEANRELVGEIEALKQVLNVSINIHSIYVAPLGRKDAKYFCSNYGDKEVATTKGSTPEQHTASPSIITDNTLKDILNTPEKLKTQTCDTLKDPETPSTTRRNVFSTTPSKKNNKTELETLNKSNAGRQSFLDMLDSMVSPIHKDNKKYEKLNTPPAPKKQAILAFPELPALSVKNVSGEDTENAEPVKVTAFVKALPNTTATCFKKSGSLFSKKLLTKPKPSISHKLGPAKTVGLKRKKSSSNDSTKPCQPSVFDMFSFQPKAKLKIQ